MSRGAQRGVPLSKGARWLQPTLCRPRSSVGAQRAMGSRVFGLFAAIAALAHAGGLDTLLVERARCEALASGEDEGEACTPVYYVELLVELGDAHLEQEERKEAAEAYELAAMDSFESLGKDSREHSTALLRLACKPHTAARTPTSRPQASLLLTRSPRLGQRHTCTWASTRRPIAC